VHERGGETPARAVHGPWLIYAPIGHRATSRRGGGMHVVVPNRDRPQGRRHGSSFPCSESERQGADGAEVSLPVGCVVAAAPEGGGSEHGVGAPRSGLRSRGGAWAGEGVVGEDMEAEGLSLTSDRGWAVEEADLAKRIGAKFKISLRLPHGFHLACGAGGEPRLLDWTRARWRPVICTTPGGCCIKQQAEGPVRSRCGVVEAPDAPEPAGLHLRRAWRA